MNTNDFWKAIATITIWVIAAVVGISVVMFSSGSYSWDMIGVPLIAAIAATFFMWVAPEFAKEDAERKALERAQVNDKAMSKQKRESAAGGDSRMALLLEMMDEDERQAFKETLKRRVLAEQRLTDDGEFYNDASLGALLEENDYRRR